MNKKKIIFIGIVVLLFIIFLILIMLSSSNKQKNSKNTTISFTIWILNDNKEKFAEYIAEFKNKNGYKDKEIIIEQFNNYQEYVLALSTALMRGQAPDIFLINNNETSFLSENTLGVSEKDINPDKFDDEYYDFFSDDLITSYGEGDDKKNFLIGVPIGYETLAIIYNKKYIEAKSFENLVSLNNAIEDILSVNRNIIPLGIGFGKTIKYSYDIASQFFMLDSVKSFEDVTVPVLKAYLSKYYDYGRDFKNDFEAYERAGINNINGFLKGQIAMIIAYPSIIEDISSNSKLEIGIDTKYIEAKPFPEESKQTGKALVNYNYFVLNKDSKYIDIGTKLLTYMYSESGQKAYLDKFRYYLPSRKSLESKYLDRVINEKIPKIKLQDFYNNGDMAYSSFNKGIKFIYDKEFEEILDNDTNFIFNFGDFKTILKCKSDKILKLIGLSSDCK